MASESSDDIAHASPQLLRVRLSSDSRRRCDFGEAHLTLLGPDVQERVLALESVGGTEPLSERVLRPVARAPSWVEQRTLFESARG